MKPHHQKIIQSMEASILTPAKFREIHPHVSREQIASICGCSIDTVHNWFSGRQPPGKGHMALLWIYHIRAIAPEGVAEILQAL